MSDGTGGVLLIEGLVCIGVPLAAIFLAKAHASTQKEKNDKAKEVIDSEIIKLTNRNLKIRSNLVKFSNENFAAAISTEERKLLIATNGPELHSAVYNFDNLINIEMEIDGNSISSPSLAGAAVGGVLFGGAGAIVGSSYKTAKKTVKTVNIKIFFDDMDHPVYNLYFLKSSLELNNNNDKVIDAIKNANDWFGRFINILEKLKRPSNLNNNNSKADEIIKLKGLLDTGVITNDEYEILKGNLLK